MLDNMSIITNTDALKDLTKADLLMVERLNKKLGRAMCEILRHDPDKIGISMNEQGWVYVDEFIEKFNAGNKGKKFYLSMPVLMEVVRTDDKQRYGLKEEQGRLMIRCRQGHSIPWLLMDFREATPPEVLYHGTIEPFLASIYKEGLKPMSRQYVHLSKDEETARKVARRRRRSGKPVILTVDAAALAGEGQIFYLSDNDVWLTGPVDSKYLKLKGDA